MNEDKTRSMGDDASSQQAWPVVVMMDRSDGVAD